MKKMMMICAAVVALLMGAGCTSTTRVEWGGKQAVRNSDGTVLVSKDGSPYYESEKNVYKDSNWLTKREERDLSVKANADGSYEASLGSRVNDVSENGIKMVTGSIEATTKLVAECAAAYVKIAGGGVATDATTAVVAKVISAFKSGGGDTEKATVTTTDNTVKVSDGSVCTTCDPQGNCTTGACSE